MNIKKLFVILGSDDYNVIKCTKTCCETLDRRRNFYSIKVDMFVYILYIILAFSNGEVTSLVLHPARAHFWVAVCSGHNVPRETGVPDGPRELSRDPFVWVVNVTRYFTGYILFIRKCFLFLVIFFSLN